MVQHLVTFHYRFEKQGEISDKEMTKMKYTIGSNGSNFHSWQNMSVSPFRIFVHLNSHSFTCFHSELKREEGREKEKWPHMLKFMQCSLMLLSCIYVLCYTELCGNPGFKGTS